MERKRENDDKTTAGESRTSNHPSLPRGQYSTDNTTPTKKNTVDVCELRETRTGPVAPLLKHVLSAFALRYKKRDCIIELCCRLLRFVGRSDSPDHATSGIQTILHSPLHCIYTEISSAPFKAQSYNTLPGPRNRFPLSGLRSK